MWTAKLNRKEENSGATKFFVDFTNGDKTHTEWCVPQDEHGFKYWVKSRLQTFEASEALKTQLSEGDEIDLSEPEKETPEPTPEEVARDAWLEQWQTYEKANSAMKALADASIEATPEEVTRFTALKTWVADNRKPEYSQFM